MSARRFRLATAFPKASLEARLLVERGISPQNLSYDYDLCLTGSCADGAFHLNSPATNFVLSVVANGSHHAVSPYSGRILNSDVSYLVMGLDSHGMTFFRFEEEGKVFYSVLESRGKVGMLFPEHDLIVYYSPGPAGIMSERAVTLRRWTVKHAGLVKYHLSVPARPIALVCGGDQGGHIGHYLWETVTGIAKVIDGRSLGKVKKFLSYNEPLGPIERLFPEIGSRADRCFNSLNEEEIFQFTLREGLCPIQIRDRCFRNSTADRVRGFVLSHCDRAVRQESEDFMSRHFPVVLVTLRFHDRIWVSFTEDMKANLAKLKARYPKLGVVFTGFSPTVMPYTRDVANAVNPKEREAVHAFRDAMPDLDIIDGVGGMVLDTIARSCHVDFFISHAGCHYLVIGWTSNKPGIIHGPSCRRVTAVGCNEHEPLRLVFDPDDITDKPEDGQPAIRVNYDLAAGKMWQKIEEIMRSIPVRQTLAEAPVATSPCAHTPPPSPATDEHP